MKRFWTIVEATREENGWSVSLDGRPVRTPARAQLLLPTEPLVRAVAIEWADVGETIDPRLMPLTGLANAAIDHAGADRATFAATLARYGEADLVCYRAEAPRALVERQAREWDPVLVWARRRFDVDFVVTTGILHVAQPAATVRRLAHAVDVLGDFHLAALSPLVTIGGSLLAALAVVETAMTADAAWDVVSLDERWQLEQWGSDAEAELVLANRRREFLAAASFLSLSRQA